MTHLPDIYTLLLTDIVDSTALTERVGDARMARLWERHDQLVRARLLRWRGREIDRTDGFLALFDAVEDAVGFAAELHEAFALLSAAEKLPFFARIGVHRGSVILLETPSEARDRGAKAFELEGLAKPVAARVMSLAGPGQTLLSAEARSALGDTAQRVVSHGHWRLKGASDPVEIFEIGPSDATFLPPAAHAKAYRVLWQDGGWRAVSEVRHGLPGERDVFIGRDREQRALADLFDEGARLVSLLGMGGMGKTRLAIRFAWSRLGDFPGGAWFCDLSDARDHSGIVSAVARALDVPLGVADPEVQLGHVIAARGACLIVLDNAEQVVAAVGTLLGRWLDRAPKACFLVTSRTLLGLSGERAMSLAPLAEEEACALFRRRATGASVHAELGDEQGPIAELVSLLDHLPLAIELAAARTSLWSPAQILSRMNDRFRVLRSGGGRQDRQATLKGVLDWSWDLLSPDEQAALAQVSVFEGGFSVEAAEEVVVLDQDWVADALQALMDRSLIRRRASGRLELLRSVQDYAAFRLDDRGDRAEVERRHGRRFAALGAEDWLAALATHGGVARRAALMGELDNLRAAARRALARGDAEIAAHATLATWKILEFRGPFREGIAMIAQTLTCAGLSARAAGRLRMALGSACWHAGSYDEAERHLEEALTVSRSIGEMGLESRVLENLAIVDRERGRLAEAHGRIDASLTLYRALGDRVGEGVALTHQGVIFREQGRLDEASRSYEAALRLHTEVGNRHGEGGALGNLANLFRAKQRPDEAQRCFEAALAIHRALGSRSGEGVTLGNLAHLHREQGRFVEARACFEDSLKIAAEVGDRRAEAHTLSNLGSLLRGLGSLNEARTCLERSLAIAREARARRLEGVALANLGVLLHMSGRLDSALDLLGQALDIYREVHNPRLEGIAQALLASLHLDRGDLDAAAAALDAGEAPSRSAGDVETLAASRCHRVVHASMTGDRERAKADFSEILTDLRGRSPAPDSELARAIERARRAVNAS